MTSLSSRDVVFLSDVLKTPVSIVKKLTEEEGDSNLLIEQASLKEFTKKQVFSISSLVAVKLLIYKYASDSNLAFSEKTYIAQIIYEKVPEIVFGLTNGGKNKVLRTFRSLKPTENSAKILLVAIGLFNENIKCSTEESKFCQIMEQGFISGGYRELAFHIPQWISLLRKIEKDEWFVESSQKALPSPSTPKEGVIMDV